MTTQQQRPNVRTLTIRWVRDDQHPSRVDSRVEGDIGDPNSPRALLNTLCEALSELGNSEALSEKELDRFLTMRVSSWLVRLTS
jgi:hypothetical protein